MHWTTLFLLFSVALANFKSHSSHVSRAGPYNSTDSFRAVAYYVNWAIYDRKFNPQDLPADKLTHVLYAFANIRPETGEVYLSDVWADTGIHFPSDSTNETGFNLYGCLKQLYLLKRRNRHLKVLLSIGGRTYSSNFATPASTASGRSAFASSAVSLVRNLGFDGIDINWEYPTDDVQANNMVQLMQAVRERLDAFGKQLNPPYHFILTVACPAGPSNYQDLHISSMDQYIDFWNFMGYDYAGNWSTATGNQANLFLSTNNSASTPFDTLAGINYYLSKGVPANKIVLGMPVYGRSFNATKGLGMPFGGVGQGTWEAGIYDFKSLPLSGATEFYDEATGSSYSYDATKAELISYDTAIVAKQKASWIKQMRLGGAMWWESSADKIGDLSLIRNVVGILGGRNGSCLEKSWNLLNYPDSVYKNLRDGMPSLASPSSALDGSTSISSLIIKTSTLTLTTTVTCSSVTTTTISGQRRASTQSSSASTRVLTSTSGSMPHFSQTSSSVQPSSSFSFSPSSSSFGPPSSFYFLPSSILQSSSLSVSTLSSSTSLSSSSSRPVSSSSRSVLTSASKSSSASAPTSSKKDVPSVITMTVSPVWYPPRSTVTKTTWIVWPPVSTHT